MNKTIKRLNSLLARELGRVPHDFEQGVYAWEWSNDLYWPSVPTGRIVPRKTESGIVAMCTEYVRAPLTNKRDRWILTKWCKPEELTDWQKIFPGAPYPAQGYRVHTNVYMEVGEEPTTTITEGLIYDIKRQLSMTASEMTEEMTAEQDKRDRDATESQKDEVEELIPAFLNHEPGNRGNRVSLPVTKQDKLRDGSLIQ
jgi:hypothetical protein